MRRSLTLYFGGLELDIVGPGVVAEQALRTVWAACLEPRAAITRRERWQVRRRDRISLWRLGPEQNFIAACAEELNVTAMIERGIYSGITEWMQPALMFHAAALSLGSAVAVLLGESNAGKSSIALACVRRGMGYLSDELTFTDGASVFGIPRALQMDEVVDPSGLPARLADLDCEVYFSRLDDGQVYTRPMLAGTALSMDHGHYSVQRLVVVELEGVGEARTRALDPVQALAALHAGARGTPAFSLGPLATEGRCYRVRWSDDDATARWLEATLSSVA